MTLYNKKYNCIFVNVPKVASDSITNVLGENNSHLRVKEFKKSFKSKKWYKIFKFGFTRHPYDRFISTYCNMYLDSKYDINDFIADERKFLGLCEEHSIYLDACTEYLCDEKKNLLVDFCGKYENLENDWDKVCKKLGLDKKLPHFNRFSGVKPKLNDRSKAILYKKYYDDFKLFNYQQ